MKRSSRQTTKQRKSLKENERISSKEKKGILGWWKTIAMCFHGGRYKEKGFEEIGRGQQEFGRENKTNGYKGMYMLNSRKNKL